MSSTSNRHLVHHFYDDIWNHQRRDIADRILHEDLRFRGSLGNICKGRNAFWHYLEDVHAALEGYSCSIQMLAGDDEIVAARALFTGKQVGPLMGIAPTGRQISWHGAGFFTIEGSKIVDIWVLGDLDALKAQLTA